MTDKEKSPLTIAHEQLLDSIGGLSELEEAKLKTANRRDFIVYGVIGSIYLALGVLTFLTAKDKSDILYYLALLMWVGIVFGLNRQLNDQRFIMNMQHGLQKIERNELKKALEADPTPVIKAVKKATK
jgi:hypothetical protein